MQREKRECGVSEVLEDSRKILHIPKTEFGKCSGCEWVLMTAGTDKDLSKLRLKFTTRVDEG